MNIGKPFDGNGKELKQADIAYTSTLIRWERIYKVIIFQASHIDRNFHSHPPAFQCQIEPRSTAAREMLERKAAALALSAEDIKP